MTKPLQEQFEEEKPMTWEEKLNSSRITGHVSGRHLILINAKETVYDDNEYMYLDEWIHNLINNAREEAVREALEKVADEVENKRILLYQDDMFVKRQNEFIDEILSIINKHKKV